MSTAKATMPIMMAIKQTDRMAMFPRRRLVWRDIRAVRDAGRRHETACYCNWYVEVSVSTKYLVHALLPTYCLPSTMFYACWPASGGSRSPPGVRGKSPLDIFVHWVFCQSLFDGLPRAPAHGSP